MNHDIKIAGATYPDVPAIKLKDTGGNEIKFIDPSDATATAADIKAGKTAYGASGELITGTGSGGGSSVNYFKKIVCANGPVDELGDTVIDGGTQLAGLYFVRNLKSATIKKIFPAAFYNSDLITSVDCPALEEIGDYAFFWCDSLESFNFNSVKKIGSYSLTHTILGGMKLPAIVEIGSNAFDSSKKITTLDLGENCTNIGTNLWGSVRLSTLTIVCRATTPPDLSGTLFYSWMSPTTLKIYVPDTAVDAYKAATNWSTYADNIKPLSEYAG